MRLFGDKEIIIRELASEDISKPENFKDFFNSLITEGVQILENKKKSLKETRGCLKAKLQEVKRKKTVFLLAEHNKKIIARVEIYLQEGSSDHVGVLRIAVRKGYRGRGLGSYLLGEILKLAKTCLRLSPKIIKLYLFATNKLAKKLYQRFGFKEVAKIPKQYQFKGKLVDEIVMILEV